MEWQFLKAYYWIFHCSLHRSVRPQPPRLVDQSIVFSGHHISRKILFNGCIWWPVFSLFIELTMGSYRTLLGRSIEVYIWKLKKTELLTIWIKVLIRGTSVLFSGAFCSWEEKFFKDGLFAECNLDSAGWDRGSLDVIVLIVVCKLYYNSALM